MSDIVSVRIGRNRSARYGGKEIDPYQWAEFKTAIRTAAGRQGLEQVGEQIGTGWWYEHGKQVSEETATLDFLAPVTGDKADGFRSELARLARQYGQDAIGLVSLGETTLVRAVSQNA